MALHRDIHWIGRQWAVTGHGMQLIDQKLQGFFDIEIARLWDEDHIATMHAKQWLNAADFDKGLAVARARFPQSMPPPVVTPEALMRDVSPPSPEPVSPPEVFVAPELAEPQQDGPADLRLRFNGNAKFLRPWRVWMKRKP